MKSQRAKDIYKIRTIHIYLQLETLIPIKWIDNKKLFKNLFQWELYLEINQRTTFINENNNLKKIINYKIIFPLLNKSIEVKINYK